MESNSRGNTDPVNADKKTEIYTGNNWTDFQLLRVAMTVLIGASV